MCQLQISLFCAIFKNNNNAFVASITPMVDPLPLEGNEWKMNNDGFVVPVWYTCPQLPPTTQKKDKKNTQHICNTSHNVPTLEAPQIITEKRLETL